MRINLIKFVYSADGKCEKKKTQDQEDFYPELKAAFDKLPANRAFLDLQVPNTTRATTTTQASRIPHTQVPQTPSTTQTPRPQPQAAHTPLFNAPPVPLSPFPTPSNPNNVPQRSKHNAPPPMRTFTFHEYNFNK
jgi:hypothetical protein